MKPEAKTFYTNLKDVPKVGGLAAKDGWVNMQVQFLVIDQKTANRRAVDWRARHAADHAHLPHRRCGLAGRRGQQCGNP